MDRSALLEYLSAAKRHAEAVETRIQAQKRIIGDLEAAGRDTAQAEQLLDLFVRAKNNYLTHIDRILDFLDKLPLSEDAA